MEQKCKPWLKVKNELAKIANDSIQRRFDNSVCLTHGYHHQISLSYRQPIRCLTHKSTSLREEVLVNCGSESKTCLLHHSFKQFVDSDVVISKGIQRRNEQHPDEFTLNGPPLNHLLWINKHRFFVGFGTDKNLRVYSDTLQRCQLISAPTVCPMPVLSMVYLEDTDEIITGGIGIIQPWKIKLPDLSSGENMSNSFTNLHRRKVSVVEGLVGQDKQLLQATSPFVCDLEPWDWVTDMKVYKRRKPPLLIATTSDVVVAFDYLRRRQVWSVHLLSVQEPVLRKRRQSSLPDLADGFEGYSSVKHYGRSYVTQGHTSMTRSTIFPRFSYFITGGREGSIRVTSLVNFGLITILQGHRDAITGLIAHPIYTILISSSIDGCIRIWCLETFRLNQRIDTGQNITNLYLGQDASLLYYSSRTQVSVYRYTKLYTLFTCLHSTPVKLVRTHGDKSIGVPGKILASMDDGSVALISPVSGVILSVIYPINTFQIFTELTFDPLRDFCYITLDGGHVLQWDCYSNPSAVMNKFAPTIPYHQDVFSLGSIWINMDDYPPITAVFAGLRNGQIALIHPNILFMESKQAHSGFVKYIAAKPRSTEPQAKMWSRDDIISVGACSIRTWHVHVEDIIFENTNKLYQWEITLVPELKLFFPEHTIEPEMYASLSRRLCVTTQHNVILVFVVESADAYKVDCHRISIAAPNTSPSPNHFDPIAKMLTHHQDDDHASRITALSSSDHLCCFASASEAGYVKLWDEENRLLRELGFAPHPVTALTFANGRDLLVGFEGRICVVWCSVFVTRNLIIDLDLLKKKFADDLREKPIFHNTKIEAEVCVENVANVPLEALERQNSPDIDPYCYNMRKTNKFKEEKKMHMKSGIKGARNKSDLAVTKNSILEFLSAEANRNSFRSISDKFTLAPLSLRHHPEEALKKKWQDLVNKVILAVKSNTLDSLDNFYSDSQGELTGDISDSTENIDPLFVSDDANKSLLAKRSLKHILSRRKRQKLCYSPNTLKEMLKRKFPIAPDGIIPNSVIRDKLKVKKPSLRMKWRLKPVPFIEPYAEYTRMGVYSRSSSEMCYDVMSSASVTKADWPRTESEVSIQSTAQSDARPSIRRTQKRRLLSRAQAAEAIRRAYIKEETEEQLKDEGEGSVMALGTFVSTAGTPHMEQSEENISLQDNVSMVSIVEEKPVRLIESRFRRKYVYSRPHWNKSMENQEEGELGGRHDSTASDVSSKRLHDEFFKRSQLDGLLPGDAAKKDSLFKGDVKEVAKPKKVSRSSVIGQDSGSKKGSVVVDTVLDSVGTEKGGLGQDADEQEADGQEADGQDTEGQVDVSKIEDAGDLGPDVSVHSQGSGESLSIISSKKTRSGYSGEYGSGEEYEEEEGEDYDGYGELKEEQEMPEDGNIDEEMEEQSGQASLSDEQISQDFDQKDGINSLLSQIVNASWFTKQLDEITPDTVAEALLELGKELANDRDLQKYTCNALASIADEFSATEGGGDENLSLDTFSKIKDYFAEFSNPFHYSDEQSDLNNLLEQIANSNWFNIDLDELTPDSVTYALLELAKELPEQFQKLIYNALASIAEKCPVLQGGNVESLSFKAYSKIQDFFAKYNAKKFGSDVHPLLAQIVNASWFTKKLEDITPDSVAIALMDIGEDPPDYLHNKICHALTAITDEFPTIQGGGPRNLSFLTYSNIQDYLARFLKPSYDKKNRYSKHRDRVIYVRNVLQSLMKSKMSTGESIKREMLRLLIDENENIREDSKMFLAEKFGISSWENLYSLMDQATGGLIATATRLTEQKETIDDIGERIKEGRVSFDRSSKIAARLGIKRIRKSRSRDATDAILSSSSVTNLEGSSSEAKVLEREKIIKFEDEQKDKSPESGKERHRFSGSVRQYITSSDAEFGRVTGIKLETGVEGNVHSGKIREFDKGGELISIKTSRIEDDRDLENEAIEGRNVFSPFNESVRLSKLQGSKGFKLPFIVKRDVDYKHLKPIIKPLNIRDQRRLSALKQKSYLYLARVSDTQIVKHRKKIYGLIKMVTSLTDLNYRKGVERLSAPPTTVLSSQPSEPRIHREGTIRERIMDQLFPADAELKENRENAPRLPSVLRRSTTVKGLGRREIVDNNEKAIMALRKLSTSKNRRKRIKYMSDGTRRDTGSKQTEYLGVFAENILKNNSKDSVESEATEGDKDEEEEEDLQEQENLRELRKHRFLSQTLVTKPILSNIKQHKSEDSAMFSAESYISVLPMKDERKTSTSLNNLFDIPLAPVVKPLQASLSFGRKTVTKNVCNAQDSGFVESIREEIAAGDRRRRNQALEKQTKISQFGKKREIEDKGKLPSDEKTWRNALQKLRLLRKEGYKDPKAVSFGGVKKPRDRCLAVRDAVDKSNLEKGERVTSHHVMRCDKLEDICPERKHTKSPSCCQGKKTATYGNISMKWTDQYTENILNRFRQLHIPRYESPPTITTMGLDAVPKRRLINTLQDRKSGHRGRSSSDGNLIAGTNRLAALSLMRIFAENKLRDERANDMKDGMIKKSDANMQHGKTLISLKLPRL